MSESAAPLNDDHDGAATLTGQSLTPPPSHFVSDATVSNEPRDVDQPSNVARHVSSFQFNKLPPEIRRDILRKAFVDSYSVRDHETGETLRGVIGLLKSEGPVIDVAHKLYSTRDTDFAREVRAAAHDVLVVRCFEPIVLDSLCDRPTRPGVALHPHPAAVEIRMFHSLIENMIPRRSRILWLKSACQYWPPRVEQIFDEGVEEGGEEGIEGDLSELFNEDEDEDGDGLTPTDAEGLVARSCMRARPHYSVPLDFFRIDMEESMGEEVSEWFLALESLPPRVKVVLNITGTYLDFECLRELAITHGIPERNPIVTFSEEKGQCNLYLVVSIPGDPNTPETVSCIASSDEPESLSENGYLDWTFNASAWWRRAMRASMYGQLPPPIKPTPSGHTCSLLDCLRELGTVANTLRCHCNA